MQAEPTFPFNTRAPLPAGIPAGASSREKNKIKREISAAAAPPRSDCTGLLISVIAAEKFMEELFSAASRDFGGGRETFPGPGGNLGVVSLFLALKKHFKKEKKYFKKEKKALQERKKSILRCPG